MGIAVVGATNWAITSSRITPPPRPATALSTDVSTATMPTTTRNIQVQYKLSSWIQVYGRGDGRDERGTATAVCADLTARDPDFDATPLTGAQFTGRDAVVAWLEAHDASR